MCKYMYEVFLLREEFFATMINVLQWTVLFHCIHRVTAVCQYIQTLLGYDRVPEKRFGGPESPGIFCKPESGNRDIKWWKLRATRILLLLH